MNFISLNIVTEIKLVKILVMVKRLNIFKQHKSISHKKILYWQCLIDLPNSNNYKCFCEYYKFKKKLCIKSFITSEVLKIVAQIHNTLGNLIAFLCSLYLLITTTAAALQELWLQPVLIARAQPKLHRHRCRLWEALRCLSPLHWNEMAVKRKSSHTHYPSLTEHIRQIHQDPLLALLLSLVRDLVKDMVWVLFQVLQKGLQNSK